MSLTHQQNAYIQKIHVLFITFFYMFRRLLRLLQGELLCMLKTVAIFCDYVSLKLLYNYWK